MLDEADNGNRLREYLNDAKNEKYTLLKIQELFNNVLWVTPEHYSYLPSVEELFREEERNGLDRYKLLKDTFSKPYQKMIKEMCNNKLDISMVNYKRNTIYTHVSNTFPDSEQPKTVVFIKEIEVQLNLCEVYSLDEDRYYNVRISNLRPFDMIEYLTLKKEWDINFHKQMLLKLEK